MNTQTRRIAGFMSAESIYSLAFYIVMVAAIAGVGAGVLIKKDAAKAVSAISLLRANYMAEGATLGYSPVPPGTNAGALELQRLSGKLLLVAPAGVTANLPGGGEVAISLKTGGTATGGFVIGITLITKPDVCTSVAGVGFGTWEALDIAAPTAGATMTDQSGAALKTACGAATVAAPVQLHFASM